MCSSSSRPAAGGTGIRGNAIPAHMPPMCRTGSSSRRGARGRHAGRPGPNDAAAVAQPEGNVYRIGIDVGGTFTDLVSVDDGGRVVLAKSASTPDDPSRG